MVNSLYRPIPKGVAGAKIPLASDVSQFYDLLNARADMGVLNLASQIQTLSTGGITAVPASGGVLGIGVYIYKFSYVTGNLQSDGSTIISGETHGSPSVPVTTTSGNQKVTISGLPAIGSWPVTAIGIRIYRTAVGGADGTQKLVTTLYTNYLRTTFLTSYLDAIADGSLGATVPTTNTTGTTLPYVDSRLYPLEREVANLKAASTIANRVDNASAIFFDLNDGLNGGSAGKIDLSKVNSTGTITATASPIIVPITGLTAGLLAGQEVTIMDDVNLERRNITGLVANTSVSFAAMTNSYKVGAMICRSSVVQDTVNKLLKFNGWSNFITNTAVTVNPNAYDTSGNNGDKLVRTANGNWITIEYNSGGTAIHVQKSIDNGVSFQALCTISGAQVGAAIAWNGGNSVTILWNTTTIVYSNTFDVTTVSGDQNANKVIVDNAMTSITNNVSIKTGSDGMPQATWSGIHPTYPNSKNPRYSKATTNAVTVWAAPTQISTTNTAGSDNTNPCIVIRATNNPVIIYQFTNGTQNTIYSTTYNGTSWLSIVQVYSVNTYSQSNPCARVAPSGRIWCAWHGKDATDTAQYNIRYSYSDDGGTTWLIAVKLTSGNTYDQKFASISVDKNNNFYVLWQGQDAVSAGYYNVFRNIWTGSAFQGAVKLTTNTTQTINNISSIDNSTLDFNLLTPPMIYADFQATAIKFSGTYGSSTPVLVEDVRYNINPPSNVSSAVAWVDHDADANYTISGAVSFQAGGGNESFAAMTKTTAAIDGSHNEDQFVGSGTSAAKATLRLTLTRNSTVLVKNISQITGAVGA